MGYKNKGSNKTATSEVSKYLLSNAKKTTAK